ncbi:MAG: hypothetical protein E6G42_03585 [Actinobacteria bacterium]|nr:MAG: hypothetical protein E6G42_03585 [Actinomycetota bacterium]
MAGEKRYAVVSCHVERPLDDRVWARFAALQASRPAGFRIAALLRPPDPEAGEEETRWLERARARREGAWLREAGLRPTLFCGGGWYSDERVAEAAAELGYTDCTATSFDPPYLELAAPRLHLDAPARLELPSGRRLVEVPSTHSIGMLARALPRTLAEPLVHVYFHDSDLLDRRRSLALRMALRLLALRRTPSDLDRVVAAGVDRDLPFRAVLPGPVPRTIARSWRSLL